MKKERTIKRTASNVVKWIKRLESGRYKKGVGVLHDDEGRDCCLGVCGRMIRKKDAPFEYELVGNHLGIKTTIGSFSSSVIVNGVLVHSLVSLNDDAYAEDTNFKNVAKFIRSHTSLVWPKSLAAEIRKQLKEKK